MGMAGGTAVVASVAGAAGAAAGTFASQQVAKEGARTAELGRRAESQDVAPGGIRIEDAES